MRNRAALGLAVVRCAGHRPSHWCSAEAGSAQLRPILRPGRVASGEALAHGLRGDPQCAGGLGDADQVVLVRRSPQAAVGTISRP